MHNVKSEPTRTTHSTLRNQRTEERDAWTASFSSRPDISASDSASRGRDVLGRQVSPTTAYEHHGGHGDE
jgi:hypothetical protein